MVHIDMISIDLELLVGGVLLVGLKQALRTVIIGKIVVQQLGIVFMTVLTTEKDLIIHRLEVRLVQ